MYVPTNWLGDGVATVSTGSTLEAEAQCWATALDIGVHRVNNDATLLPDTHVVGRTENSGGVPGTAAVSVVSLMCAASGQVPGTACNTSSVIIGPYQDDTTLTSQSVAAYFTVPQVSPTASTPALNKEVSRAGACGISALLLAEMMMLRRRLISQASTA